MQFEWDPVKAASNLRKHGVSFDEAMSVFSDTLATTFPDDEHSLNEIREVTIGRSKRHRLVAVSHCERRGRIRIISARKLTRAERTHYEES
jgi:uncharacterized DUF497 family protein